MRSLSVKKRLILEWISFMLLIIHGLFSRYFEFGYYTNRIILVLFIIIVIRKGPQITNYIRQNLMVAISLILWMLCVFINVIISENKTHLSGNVSVILFGMVTAGLLFVLVIVSKNAIISWMYRGARILNILWIINIVVLLIQINGTGFLIKDSWLSLNSFYPDQCCGLFGNSGTHELSFFSVFMTLFNVSLAMSSKSKKKRNAFLMYTIIMNALILFCSFYNDNKAYISILFAFVIIYMFAYQLITGMALSSRIKGVVMVAILVWIVINVMPLLIPSFGSWLNEYIDKILQIFNVDASSTGGNERLAIFEYAMLLGKGWTTGAGIGNTSLINNTTGSFRHFGINSIGSFTYVGGIWFYLVHLNWYRLVYQVNTGIRKKIIFNIAIILVYIICSIYSNIFTSTVSIFWMEMTSLSILFLKTKRETK